MILHRAKRNACAGKWKARRVLSAEHDTAPSYCKRKMSLVSSTLSSQGQSSFPLWWYSPFTRHGSSNEPPSMVERPVSNSIALSASCVLKKLKGTKRKYGNDWPSMIFFWDSALFSSPLFFFFLFFNSLKLGLKWDFSKLYKIF